MAKKIKCGATPEVVEEHNKLLQCLNNRTIRIEAGIAVAVFMIMALGGWEYFKDKKEKESKREYIEKKAELPTVVRKSDLEHGVYY